MKQGVLLLALMCSVAGAQTADNSAATFRIAGSVTDAITGEPIRRASLTLQFVTGSRPARAAQAAMSDAGGHFEFYGVSPGQYRLWAERRGYGRQEFAPSAGLVVTADQPTFSFRLQPYAVLTGVVVDENGDPVLGAAIQLIRSAIQSGARELSPGPSALTDDRGEYRVASLQAGRYYVSAYARAQAAGEHSAYPRRFFPGVTNIGSAQALDLEAGTARRADFRLDPSPAFHIRGRIVGAVALSGFSVALASPVAAEAFGTAPYSVRMDADGRFDLPGVTPGQYLLTAAAYKGAAIQTASELVIVATSDVDDIRLAPGPGADIAAHVTVEQRDGAPALTEGQIAIAFEPDGSITRPAVAAVRGAGDGLRWEHVLPGDYTFRVNVPEPYYVKSAAAGGLDLLDAPLMVSANEVPPPVELVIGAHGGEVSGAVTSRDQPAPNCTVLLTRPRAHSPSLNRLAVTDETGRFLVRAVAPGEYVAYAWRDVTAVAYRDPEALSRYQGWPVTVAEGAKHAVDLKLNGD